MKKLGCGCIIYADGSIIPCWKHLSPEMKRTLKKSVRVR